LNVVIICVNAFCGSADSTVRIKDSIRKNVKIKRYHVNYWVTGSIIVVGFGTDFLGIRLLQAKQGISDEELLFINTQAQKDLINPIDRWALNQNPSNRDLYTKISDYGQIGIFLLPSLLMIDKNIRKDWLDLLLMYLEGHAVTFTFYNFSPLGPQFQNRYRPIAYYPEFPIDERNKCNNRNSFYSGHVASCAYSTFFMAKVYCDYHPNLGALKYLIYLAAAVPPALIGYARIGSLSHFTSDVAVGFALGAIIGIVLPELHKNRRFKNLALGMFTAPEAMGFTVRWKLPDKRLLTLSK